MTITHGNNRTKAIFHMTKEKIGMLLSCHTSQVLGLLFFAKQVHESRAKAIKRGFLPKAERRRQVKSREERSQVSDKTCPWVLQYWEKVLTPNHKELRSLWTRGDPEEQEH